VRWARDRPQRHERRACRCRPSHGANFGRRPRFACSNGD
jgi:hypothetical protein